MRSPTPRNVLVMVLTGAAAAALLGSHGLLSWAGALSSRTSPAMEANAAAWDGALARLGLVRPYEALRGELRAVEGRRFAAGARDGD
jgi:hypothetical protein